MKRFKLLKEIMQGMERMFGEKPTANDAEAVYRALVYMNKRKLISWHRMVGGLPIEEDYYRKQTIDINQFVKQAKRVKKIFKEEEEWLRKKEDEGANTNRT